MTQGSSPNVFASFLRWSSLAVALVAALLLVLGQKPDAVLADVGGVSIVVSSLGGNTYEASGAWNPQGGQCWTPGGGGSFHYLIEIYDDPDGLVNGVSGTLLGTVDPAACNSDYTSPVDSANRDLGGPWPASGQALITFTLGPGTHNICALLRHVNQNGQDIGSTSVCAEQVIIIPTPTPTSVPPTATSVPPTATSVPPTATSVPPTATSVLPTATSVPPTATSVPPTATSVPPTATSIPPEATSVPPTATSVPPEATFVPPTATSVPATATSVPATATSEPPSSEPPASSPSTPAPAIVPAAVTQVLGVSEILSTPPMAITQVLAAPPTALPKTGGIPVGLLAAQMLGLTLLGLGWALRRR